MGLSPTGLIQLSGRNTPRAYVGFGLGPEKLIQLVGEHGNR